MDTKSEAAKQELDVKPSFVFEMKRPASDVLTEAIIFCRLNRRVYEHKWVLVFNLSWEDGSGCLGGAFMGNSEPWASRVLSPALSVQAAPSPAPDRAFPAV